MANEHVGENLFRKGSSPNPFPKGSPLTNDHLTVLGTACNYVADVCRLNNRVVE